jgi:putative nucleotidyltransferase with HDIG domain
MTIGRRRPPRLLVKALLVTFGTVAALLLLVFLFVRMSVREQVRLTVTQNLDVSQRMLAALEERRLHELRTQAQTLAENPTLKAAMDTYAAETSQADDSARVQLLATVQRELDKLAARVETDAVALATMDGETLAASGRLGASWARDRADARLLPAAGDPDAEALIEAGGTLFRVVRVALTLDDGATIGWLDLGNALDMHYAELLDQMSRARIAIVHKSSLVATTLSPAEAPDFQSIIRKTPPVFEPIDLDGSSHAYREIAHIGSVQIFALSSVDDAAAAALSRMNVVLAVLAFGAFALALVGSILLARLLSRPIERLSGAIDQMAAARDLTRPLPATGSSRELDLLTSNFNHLMASVVEAESRTEAAYAAAIRALAAALDARDPYTAGHSERVSTLSVAIGRVLKLPESDIEVLRLGALLHDIGKIGIPDSVLRKPGPLTDEEFEAITEHPVVGARILRTIPFLLPHVDIVELHHERPDGLGYPRGLRGDDIPLLARIVHVADAYDAITSARAYRQGRSSDEALRELWRCAGTEYHADIVGALARALPRLAPVAATAPASPGSVARSASAEALSA